MPARANSMPPAQTEAPASNTRALPAPPASSSKGLTLPTLQAESPITLAARAETLPPKASAVLQDLAGLARARGVSLRAGRTIMWDRIVNQEAVLGYTRGKEASEACVSCKRQAGPFVKCVVVDGKLLGACTNCHYGSGGCRCSFREYFLVLIFISDYLQVNLPLQALQRDQYGVPNVLRPLARPLRRPIERNGIAKSQNYIAS
jgi:Protein of unknown function (DUF3716)